MTKPSTPLTSIATTAAYLLIIVSMAAYPPTKAQSPAPAPSPGQDCFSTLIDMADCLSFVQNGSTLRKPDPLCCPEISNIINTQPVCLCKFLANSSQFDLSDIDTSRALELPTLCNISAPSVELCALVGVPVPGAGLAPSPSPASSSTINESGSPTSNLKSSSKIIGLLLVLLTCLVINYSCAFVH